MCKILHESRKLTSPIWFLPRWENGSTAGKFLLGSMPLFLLGVFWKGTTRLMSRFSQPAFDFYTNSVIGCVPSHLYVGKMCLCWAISISFMLIIFSFFSFLSWCLKTGVLTRMSMVLYHLGISTFWQNFLLPFPLTSPAVASQAFFLCLFQTFQAYPHPRTLAHASSITYSICVLPVLSLSTCSPMTYHPNRHMCVCFLVLLLKEHTF